MSDKVVKLIEDVKALTVLELSGARQSARRRIRRFRRLRLSLSPPRLPLVLPLRLLRKRRPDLTSC